jgi:hypothetical protein
MLQRNIRAEAQPALHLSCTGTSSLAEQGEKRKIYLLVPIVMLLPAETICRRKSCQSAKKSRKSV